MLRVVYGSLMTAARDLDDAVEGVSVCALDREDAAMLGAVEGAWLAFAQAWTDGVVQLAMTQRGLADALRQVAESYRDSDQEAASTIARVLG